MLFFGTQIFTIKKQFTHDTEALGQIIGHNSTAALTFEDPKVATDILTALQAEPYVVQAAILRPDGTTLAQYSAKANAVQIAISPGDGYQFVGHYLTLVQPIILDGERIGTLHLVSDYRSALFAALHVYGPTLAAVFLLSIAMASVLASRMQHIISRPILSLATVARKIADNKNYSVRVPKVGNDEVGVLTEAFNQMLEEIQSHHAVLCESEERFRQLAENINEVFWISDVAKSKMAYISPAYEAIWGRSCKNLYTSPREWMEAIHPDDRERVAEAVRTKQTRGEYNEQYRIVRPDGAIRWVRDRAFPIQNTQGEVYRVVGIAEDITARKQTEAELGELNRHLVISSRQAGMAEVATGVLHNVGNVLNSVNVSLTLIRDHLRQSEVASLIKVAGLLQLHAEDLVPFLTTHTKGKLVPGLIIQLAEQLGQEHAYLQEMNKHLTHNVDHIKVIVAMQQSYATISGVREVVSITSLLDDALQMHTAGLERHGVQVRREYTEVPALTVDKHMVLQILVNLIHNAKYALDASGRSDRLLTVGVAMNGAQRVKVTVADNGIGIPPENLTRIFSVGFTTRKDGHGFGLHSGANAAKEMGGILKAHSEGLGKGATFTLELPLVNERVKP